MGGENGLVGWGGGRNMIREGPQGEGGNFGARKIKERGGGSRRGRGNCLEEVQIKKFPHLRRKLKLAARYVCGGNFDYSNKNCAGSEAIPL